MRLSVSLDPARSGEENMALDQAMLERAERDQTAYLRLYRWSEPTLSLGHFQSLEDRAQHVASQQIAVVKRASGGGAIVHDQEWTYAVALPLSRNQVGASTELYDAMHDALVSLFRRSGWAAQKWTQLCALTPTDEKKPAKPPFLCFQRRSCGDIIIGDHKVVGSAQRRLGTSVLQHGSIVWRRSAAAPEINGIFDIPTCHSVADEQQKGALSTNFNVVFAMDSTTKWFEFGPSLLSWLEQCLAERFPQLVRS